MTQLLFLPSFHFLPQPCCCCWKSCWMKKDDVDVSKHHDKNICTGYVDNKETSFHKTVIALETWQNILLTFNKQHIWSVTVHWQISKTSCVIHFMYRRLHHPRVDFSRNTDSISSSSALQHHPSDITEAFWEQEVNQSLQWTDRLWWLPSGCSLRIPSNQIRFDWSTGATIGQRSQQYKSHSDIDMDGFLRKSNSDKVYMEFWEVDFLVANTQFTYLRFVLVSRETMMMFRRQSSKMDVVQHHKQEIRTCDSEIKPSPLFIMDIIGCWPAHYLTSLYFLFRNKHQITLFLNAYNVGPRLLTQNRTCSVQDVLERWAERFDFIVI